MLQLEDPAGRGPRQALYHLNPILRPAIVNASMHPPKTHRAVAGGGRFSLRHGEGCDL